MLSARNNFTGIVKSMTLDTVMAEVVITVGGFEVVSLISRASADKMAIKVGDEVTAVVKSTEVMISKPDWACLQP